MKTYKFNKWSDSCILRKNEYTWSDGSKIKEGDIVLTSTGPGYIGITRIAKRNGTYVLKENVFGYKYDEIENYTGNSLIKLSYAEVYMICKYRGGNPIDNWDPIEVFTHLSE